MAKALLIIHVPDVLLRGFLQTVRTFEATHNDVTIGLSIGDTNMTPDEVDAMLRGIHPPFQIVDRGGV